MGLRTPAGIFIRGSPFSIMKLRTIYVKNIGVAYSLVIYIYKIEV